MTTYVALLRGVNIGGHKLVAMADLRALCTDVGFTDVQSLLQSGNLIFRSRPRAPGALERLLEAETSSRLGLDTRFFVRTAEEWKAIVRDNPFPAQAERDPAHLAVLFLKDAPEGQTVDALHAAIRGPELVRAHARELYAVYPAGIGRSTLTATLIERMLATRVTGRNWNTVLKLLARAAA
jgi:uncharacterized protein (DUF1697 family)